MEQSLNMQQGVKEKLFLIFASFILLYFHTLQNLVHVWMTEEDYGHGFIILPIILYLIWRRKDIILTESSEQPSTWSIVLLFSWIFFYVTGIIGHIYTFINFSMILFPIGSFALLLGSRAVKETFFPILFMVFMFPIPAEIYTRITNPLMLFATSLSYHFVSALNVPLLQEGNLLSLPNYSMQVVNACSGIRSLMMILALGYLIGYLMTPSNLTRILFILISIPIAILGNIVRISATILLAYYISPKAAEGFSHTFAGLVTFILSLIILFYLMEFILWFSKKKES